MTFKRKFSLLLKTGAVLASMAGLFGFTACKEHIGLGEAVDTAAPTISITYPAVGSIIRDSFVVYGDCADESGVASVTASIVKDNVVYATRNAVLLKAGKKWSVELNDFDNTLYTTTNGWQVPDGEYEVQVYATDNSGRKSAVDKRTYQIDNTPPVFIIDKPDSKASGKNKYSKYGSLFTVDGTIVDDHEIDSLELEVYSAVYNVADGTFTVGELVSEGGTGYYIEENIPTAGGTNLTVARATGTGINNERYCELYTGSKYGVIDTSEGNKYFASNITIRDNAKAYKNPTGDERSAEEQAQDKKGNATNDVYLYSEVYNTLQSTKNGYGLTGKDFKIVLNGTAKDSDIAGKGVLTFPPAADNALYKYYEDGQTFVQFVRACLKGFGDNTKQEKNNYLIYSLNPNSDPTYTITGYDLNLSKLAGASTAPGGQAISVYATYNTDNVKFYPNTLKVWLKKIGIINAAGNAVVGSGSSAAIDGDAVINAVNDLVSAVKNAENVVEADSEYSKDGATQAEKTKIFLDEITNGTYGVDVVNGNTDKLNDNGYWYLMTDNSADESSTESNYNLSTTVPSFVEKNSIYVIVLTGHDIDNNYFNQNNKFGFIGNIAGTSPTLTFESPSNLAYKATTVYNASAAADSVESLSFKGVAKETTSGMYIQTITARLYVKDENSGAFITSSGTGAAKKDYIETSISTTKVGEGVYWTGNTDWFKATYTGSNENDYIFIPANWSELTDAMKVALHSGYYTEAEGAKSLMYTVEIIASSSSGFSTSQERSVHIDGKRPDVSISSVSPTVSGSEYFGDSDTNTYLNGKISVNGFVDEINLEEVVYQIWAKRQAAAGAMTQVTLGGKNEWSLGKASSIKISNLDTNEITKAVGTAGKDERIEVEIRIIAKDTVGNTHTYSTTESAGKAYVIYQETDRPKIVFNDTTDTTITTKDLEKIGATNLFGSTSNNYLSLTLSDDDSITDYRVYLYDQDGNLLDSDDLFDAYSSNPVVTPVGKPLDTKKYYVPATEGVYKIMIEARDYLVGGLSKAEEESLYPYGKKVCGPFYIAVNSGAPKLNVTVPATGDFVGQSQTVTVTGTVNKDAVVTGYVSKVTKNKTTGVETLTKIDSTAFTATVSDDNKDGIYEVSGAFTMPADADGSYRLFVQAADLYKQTSDVNINLSVDITAPQVKIETYSSFYNATAIELTGTVTDENFSATNEYMEVVLVPSTGTAAEKTAGTKSASVTFTPAGTGSYTWKALFTGLAGTSYNIAAVTHDLLNNYSVISSDSAYKNAATAVTTATKDCEGTSVAGKTITIDTTVPVSTFTLTTTSSAQKVFCNKAEVTPTGTNPNGTKYYLLSSDDVYYTNGKFTLSGVITEESLAVARMTYNSDSATETTLTVTDGKWTYTPAYTASFDGTYAFDLSMEDMATNANVVKANVTIDTKPPVLVVSNIETDFDNLITKKILTEANPNYSATGYTAQDDANYYKYDSAAAAALGVTVPVTVTRGYLVSGSWSDAGGQGTNELWFALGYIPAGKTEIVWWYQERVMGVAQSAKESAFNFYIPLVLEHTGVYAKVWGNDAAGNESVPMYYDAGASASSTTASSDKAKVALVKDLSLDFKAPVIKLVANGTSIADDAALDAATGIENGTTIKTTKMPYKVDAYFIDNATSVPSSNPLVLTVNDGQAAAITTASYTNNPFSNGKGTPGRGIINLTGVTNESTAVITITGKDTHGRDAEVRTFNVAYDPLAPRVTINSYESFYASKAIEITGKVADRNFSAASGYLNVYLVPSTGTAAEKTAGTQTAAVTYTPDGAGQYTWTANFISLEDREYNLAVVAHDTFDNYSVYSSDAAYTNAEAVDGSGNPVAAVTKENSGMTIKKLTVDFTAPASTVNLTTGSDTQKVVFNKAVISKDAGKTYYTLDSNKIYYTNGSFVLGGTITENNLTSSKLTMAKEGGISGEVSFTTGGSDAGDWTYNPGFATNGDDDGSYEYTLTLTDKAGLTFTKTVTVVVDTAAPSISFTSPGEGESFETAASIGAKIAYADDGAGVATVDYSVLDITESAAGTAVAASKYKFTKGSSTGSFAFNSGFTAQGAFKIVVSVTDWLGQTSDQVERTFFFDKDKPVLTETNVGDDGVITNAGTIVLSGEVSDTNALFGYDSSAGTADGSVVITTVIGGKDVELNASVTAASKTTATWEYTFYTKSNTAGVTSSAENYLPDGSYVISVAGKDTASKTTQLTRSVKVDTKDPVFGDGTADTSDPAYDSSNVIPHVSTSSSTGDDGSTVWYNTNELKISGTVSDGAAGTGIANVSYETTTDGTIWTSPVEMAGTKNWSGAVAGITATTRVRITAVDNAGNDISTTLGPWNIDTTDPEVTDGSIKIGKDSDSAATGTTWLSNGTESVYISGNVTDAGGSKIKEVYVLPYEKISESTKIAANKASLNAATGDFEYTLANTKITKGGSVYGRVYDYAGNYTDTVLFTITFDNTAPEMVLTVPDFDDADGIQINGSDITLTVNYSDDNEFDVVTGLQYNKTSATAADNAWTNATGVSITAGNYYSISGFDTTKLTDETTYYLRAIGRDRAGNTGYSPVETVYVSQKTDIPKLYINNDIADIDGSYYLKHKTTFTGTITDDDEAASKVKSLIIAETLVTDVNASTVTNLATLSKTGSWSVTLSDKTNGSKVLYIYVVDNKDSVFYLGNATVLPGTSAVKMIPSLYSAEDSSVMTCGASGGFEYNLDTDSPDIISIEGQTYDSKNVITVPFASLNADFVAGGPKQKYFILKATGDDASGIAGMTLDISYDNAGTPAHIYRTTAAKIGSETVPASYTVDGSFTPTTGAGETSWTLSTKIDLSAIASGTMTATLTVYDGAGLTSVKSPQFVVDNDGPVINIQSPANGIEVTGDVNLAGYSVDAGGSTIAKTYYMIPKASEVAAALATSDPESFWLGATFASRWSDALASGKTASYWQFDFTKDGGNLLSSYSIDDYDTDGNTTNGYYLLNMLIKSEDELGNASVKYNYYLNSNPDGDKPKITFTYPTEKNYLNYHKIDEDTYTSDGYVVVGGTIRLTGSVIIPSQSTTPKSVYIQIAKDAGGAATEYGATDKANAAAATNFGYITVDGKEIYVNQGGLGYAVVNAYDVIKDVMGYNYSSSTTFPNAEFESEASFLKTVGFDTRASLNAWWGIKANSTSASWNLPINESGELNPSTGTKEIKVRACGVNADGKFGLWSTEYCIHVDNSAPTIEYSIQQLDVAVPAAAVSIAAEATSTASQPYAAEMYLKGTWYIVATVLDESGLKSYTITDANKNAVPHYYMTITDRIVNGTKKSGYMFYILLDKTYDGKKEIVISAKDNDASEHTTEMIFNINIDNTAPEIKTLLGNSSTDLNSTWTAASPAQIEESDYIYTLNGTTEDNANGSGFDKMMFYFIRDNLVTDNNYSEKVIMDPVLTNGTEVLSTGKIDNSKANTNVKVLLTDATNGSLTKLTIAQGSSSYYVYGKTVAGTLTSTQVFKPTTAAQITANKHIRAGGVIYLGGVYRSIDSINSTTGAVTFTPATTSTTLSESPVFPYAQVVDSTNGETGKTYSAADFEKIENDDGDGIIDKINRTAGTWSAIMHSSNLPDGPANLVVLAFDAAGNVSSKTIPVTITNNAPRLAKVFLATDLNSNETFEDSEFEEFSVIGDTGAYQEAYKLTVADYTSGGTYTVKDKLAVVPEIVGGNGQVKMVAQRNKATAAADIAATDAITSGTSGSVTLTSIASGTSAQVTPGEYSATITKTDASSAYSFSTGKFAAAAAGHNFWAYVLDNKTLTGIAAFDTNATTAAGRKTNEAADGTGKKFGFTFWDSTEETTCGTTSQKAVFYVTDFAYDLTDGQSPTVVVNPFYWAGASENSLYENKTTNGHIELEKDWKKSASYAGTATSGQYDGDPKVSGKIVLTGTAYDEHSIAGLAFTMTGFNSGASNSMATYSTATSKWTPSAATMAANGYEVTITSVAADLNNQHGYYDDSVYFNQTGHKIYWTLAIDTAKIANSAAADVTVTVLATDRAGNVTSSAAGSIVAPVTTSGYVVTDGTTNYPAYKVDVVPYITSLTTALTNLEKKNPSVYGRSALGSYPVYYHTTAANGSASAESIGINGFNIPNGATVTMNNATATLAAGKISIPAAAATGELSVTVNSIISINNMNDNDACGDYVFDPGLDTLYKNYMHYYNRQPNNSNNDNLTDNVHISVWGINSRAARATSSVLDEVDMHVNPQNGMLGFAFTSGAERASYPYGTNSSGTAQAYSYYQWSWGWTSVNTISFVYDKQGHMFGTQAGTDTYTPSWKASRFRLVSSIWGPTWNGTDGMADANTCYSANNALRLEYMGKNVSSAFVANPKRFSTPRMAASIPAASSTTTNLYMLYYDDMDNEIRFRAGGITNNAALSGSTGFSKAASKFGDFQDDAYQATTQNNQNYATNYTNCSVVASSSTTYKAGKMYDVAVVPDVTVGGSVVDVAVIVWYDSENRHLLYSYMVNPITNNRTNKNATTHRASAWSDPVKIHDGSSGGYCAIKVDEDKHVHIASYSTENAGSLVYTYLDTYDAAFSSEKNSAVVESYGTTGWNLTLELAKNSAGKTIPYIGSFMTSIQKPKYSYLVDTESSGANGTTWAPKAGADDENMFTGAWESVMLPMQSTRVEGNINIGVYKYLAATTAAASDDGKAKVAGEIRAIPVRTASLLQNTGVCGGNGTVNPVLGYGITYNGNGFIETAQLK